MCIYFNIVEVVWLKGKHMSFIAYCQILFYWGCAFGVETFFFNTFPPEIYETDYFSIECIDKLLNFINLMSKKWYLSEFLICIYHVNKKHLLIWLRTMFLLFVNYLVMSFAHFSVGYLVTYFSVFKLFIS